MSICLQIERSRVIISEIPNHVNKLMISVINIELDTRRMHCLEDKKLLKQKGKIDKLVDLPRVHIFHTHLIHNLLFFQ